MVDDAAREPAPDVAAAFRGLADPYRLRIFLALQDIEHWELPADPSIVELPHTVEYVARSTNINPALVENHLLELRRAGLVVFNEGAAGQAIVRVEPRRLAHVKRLLEPEEG